MRLGIQYKVVMYLSTGNYTENGNLIFPNSVIEWLWRKFPLSETLEWRTVDSSAGQLTLASGVHVVTTRRYQARPPEPAMQEYERAPVWGSLGPQAWAVGGRHCGVSELALSGSMPGGSIQEWRAPVKSWRLEIAGRMEHAVSQSGPHLAPTLWEWAEWYF